MIRCALLVCLVLTACGSSEDGGGGGFQPTAPDDTQTSSQDATDASGTPDVDAAGGIADVVEPPADAVADTAADTADDAAADTGPDPVDDAVADADPDPLADATPDATADVAHDAVADAAHDAAADTGTTEPPDITGTPDVEDAGLTADAAEDAEAEDVQINVPPGPTDKTCNGIDDDDDGAIDEGWAAMETSCGVGACMSTGLTACADGVLSDNCTPGEAVTTLDAICDTVDDDCDGSVDEDYLATQTTCGVGACLSTGWLWCDVTGEADTCVPTEPMADDSYCNGIDEDCDGETDEDYVETSTSCGAGVCAATGVLSCVNGDEVDSCDAGEPAPWDQTCDLVDEDCDGETDEDYVETQTSCGVGACASVGWVSCSDGVESESCEVGEPVGPDVVCDGEDADCDGAIDEGYVASDTSCGVGACASTGVLGCVDGAESDSCEAGEAAASDQTCDLVDEDCDGETDEGFIAMATSCGVGACASVGWVSCADGVESDSCEVGAAAADDASCDGVDDDCDGVTDQDYQMTDTSCGVGACAAVGVRACVDGVEWDSCEVGPAGAGDASCDGVDDDCDGETDEDFLGMATSCGVGVCASQGWVSCVDGVESDTCALGEPLGLDDASCDGVDGDCDGLLDEDYGELETSCGVGACAAAGVLSCVAGSEWDSCQAGEAAEWDLLCDAVDEDCDGAIDEDYVVLDTWCGLGDCMSGGWTTCADGVVTDNCVAWPAESEDDASCEGLDNDCDGAIDEDYESVASICGLGPCASTGVVSCVDGGEVDDCVPGEAAASDYTCDAVDDDCDGLTDEDLDMDGVGCLDLVEPADVTATSPFGTRVDLDWTDMSYLELAYEVWRGCEDDDGANADGLCLIATLPPDTQSYRDSQAPEGSEVTYRVDVVAADEQVGATVTVDTAPALQTAILPRPQGAWRLGDAMTLPTSVTVGTNADLAELRLLMRDGDPHSFPGRLAAGGYGIKHVGDWDAPDACVPTAEVCDGADNDCDGFTDENDICRGAYLPITAGTFVMGSPESEPCRADDEVAHEVTLTTHFLMKDTEVTQGEWASLLGVDPTYFSESGAGEPCGATCPVENLTLADAALYCNELSAAEGLAPCYTHFSCVGEDWGVGLACALIVVNAPDGEPQGCEGYRLPTEAEWEYAARASTVTATHGGDIDAADCEGASDVLGPLGWYQANAPDGPQPVGQKTANPWGLHDMLGNVAEWTTDTDGDYGSDAVVDPHGVGGAARIVRGGGWNTTPATARSAARRSLAAEIRDSGVGFRPVRTVASPESEPEPPGVEVPGLLEVRFHLIGGEPVADVPEGLVGFERMGDEGYVLLVEPGDDGVRIVVSAAAPVGLYRGGMALLGLLLEPDLSAPLETVDHQIALSYPDHGIRAAYDDVGIAELSDDDPTQVEAQALASLDEQARSGATHYFMHGASYPLNEAWWDDMVFDRFVAYRDAAADRFVELIFDVGSTGPSASVVPWGYAFIDGLGVHEEPFLLEEGADGTWRAAEEIDSPQLVSDDEMSDPAAWTTTDCDEPTQWSYDAAVGHDTPGSWRLDGKGLGNCAWLEQDIDAEAIVDGRYLLTVWARSDLDGAYEGPYTGGNGQITMTLTFADGSTLELIERSIGISSDIANEDTTPVNSDGSDWFELKHTFVIDGVAEGNPVVDAGIRSRSMNGVGTYWLDEMTLERIDGKLRNIVGGVHPPLVTGSGGQTTYIEGLDYVVCQIGEGQGVADELCTPALGSGLGAPQYETVYWPNNPGGTLAWGLEPRYSRRLNPFEIRWLPDGDWPPDDRVLVSYDIALAYQAQNGMIGGSHVAQRYNYCSFDAVYEALDWDAAFDRVLGGEEGQLGLDHRFVNLSEVRGVNRSVGCFEETDVDGVGQRQAISSNAALFADVSNRLIAAGKARKPDGLVFMWDDMFNPFTNGGHDDYQWRYGGVYGRTACALGPQHLPTLCEGVDDVTPLDGDVVMIPWTYKPKGLRQLVATGQWYDSIDRPWLSGPGGVEVTLEDWASAAHGSTHVLGASNFFFHGDIVPQSIQTYWNHDWVMRYLVDFETSESSFFQLDAPAFTVTEGVATQDNGGDYANGGSGTSYNFVGNYDGGVRVEAGSDVVGVLNAVDATPRRLYRVAVHTRRTDDATSTATAQVRLRFDRGDLGEHLGDWLETTLIASIGNGFERYETDEAGIESPAGTVAVSVEVSLGADGEFDALDDIVLWESVPPCFDGCED